ncbi:MAG: hypothetical protein H0V26_01640 [Solirubrobacterales bacterium]|nr:hypothetical protein [Solirubrobacterales bacterium]
MSDRLRSIVVGLFDRKPEVARRIVEPWLAPGGRLFSFFDAPATHAALDPSGWLHTGDLGMFDADGFLTVTGSKRHGNPG